MNTTGSYDYARRRKTTRSGRQKGCYIYIPAEELAKAGFEPGGDLPWYRIWGSRRGITLRLYREGNANDGPAATAPQASPADRTI